MGSIRLWAPLVVALVLNAAANVLLKLGAATEKPVTSASSPLERVTSFLNGVTLAALVLFGLNILFYRKALQGIALSVAYPVMLSGSLLLATVAARFIPTLGERITPVQLWGMALVVVGVWLVTRTP